MYKIKKFSQITGISEFNLRYFDQIGLLPAERDNSRYRLYHPRQIAMAHLILSLQKAHVSNEKIKSILMDYSSKNSQSALCYAQHAIDETLHQLTCARHFLTTQIERQMLINDAKRRLNNPFIEERNIEPLGIFSINTPNIIVFFKYVSEVSGNPDWYLRHRYGFIVERESIQKNNYKLMNFFCNEPNIINKHGGDFPAGSYFSGFYKGSLENNPAVSKHLSQADDNGMNHSSKVIIEHISGPATVKCKSEFLIKVMYPCHHQLDGSHETPTVLTPSSTN